MELASIPITPAQLPGTAVPAAQAQAAGNPAVAEAGGEPAPGFAALLAAGLALPPVAPGIELAAGPGMGKEQETATDLPAAEPDSPDVAGSALDFVFAAIALPGAASVATAARPAVPASDAEARTAGLDLPALPPAAARPGRDDAPMAQLLPGAPESDLAQTTSVPHVDGIAELGTTLPPTPATLARAQHAASAHAPAATAELRLPVGTGSWDAQLGRMVTWMAGGQLQVAEVRLNPPDLGPLEIVLRLSGEDGSQASVTFASPHAEVRAALETALPRLRDMLADSGITLGQADVNAESFRDGGEARRNGLRGGDAERSGTAAAAAPAGARAGIGLVDIFA